MTTSCPHVRITTISVKELFMGPEKGMFTFILPYPLSSPFYTPSHRCTGGHSCPETVLFTWQTIMTQIMPIKQHFLPYDGQYFGSGRSANPSVPTDLCTFATKHNTCKEVGYCCYYWYLETFKLHEDPALFCSSAAT